MKASKLMVVLAMASVTVAFGKNGTAKAKLKSGKNAFSRRSNRQGGTSDFPLAFLVCGLVL